jgi:transposase
MYFIGCDVAKLTLDLAWRDPTTGRWSMAENIPNDKAGWQTLIRWAEDLLAVAHAEICVVMEATAVYHLRLATYLSQQGVKVLVSNPGRAAEYGRSQNRRNKSDRLDARSLQRYGAGLERPHWFQPDPPQIRQLKALLSLLDQLDKDQLRWQNRLEKATYQEAANPVPKTIQRQLHNLQREQGRTQQAIADLIQSDAQLRQNQYLMCSIKGVSTKTSQRLLPLVHGGRFDSARQLAAFLGLTPCHASSGTSLHKPGQLSGRGDAVLRAKLYMPALSAKQHNPQLSAFYSALLARGKTPKQATTAVMRKLVHLCYGVVKNQTPYQDNYAALS